MVGVHVATFALVLLTYTTTALSLETTILVKLFRVTQHCHCSILAEINPSGTQDILLEEIRKIQAENQIPTDVKLGYESPSYDRSRHNSPTRHKTCSVHLALPGEKGTGTRMVLKYMKDFVNPTEDLFVVVATNRKRFSDPMLVVRTDFSRNFLIIQTPFPENNEEGSIHQIKAGCDTIGSVCEQGFPASLLRDGNSYLDLLKYFKDLRRNWHAAAIFLRGPTGWSDIQFAKILAEKFNFTLNKFKPQKFYIWPRNTGSEDYMHRGKPILSIPTGLQGIQAAYIPAVESKQPQLDFTILTLPFHALTWYAIIVAVLSVSMVLSMKPDINSLVKAITVTPASLLLNRYIEKANGRLKFLSTLFIFCFFLIASSYRNYYLRRVHVAPTSQMSRTYWSIPELVYANYTLAGKGDVKFLLLDKISRSYFWRESKLYSAVENMSTEFWSYADVFRAKKTALIVNTGQRDVIKSLEYQFRDIQFTWDMLFQETECWSFNLLNLDVVVAGFVQLQNTGIYSFHFRSESRRIIGISYDEHPWRGIKVTDAVILAALTCFAMGLGAAIAAFILLEPLMSLISQCRHKLSKQVGGTGLGKLFGISPI